MCNFFSFVQNAKGEIFYHGADDRRAARKKGDCTNLDSHSTIVFNKISKASCAQDKCNSYEWDGVQLIEDTIVRYGMTSAARRWIKAFSVTQEFSDICAEMVERNNATDTSRRLSKCIEGLPANMLTKPMCKFALRFGTPIKKVPVAFMDADMYVSAIKGTRNIDDMESLLKTVPKQYITPKFHKHILKYRPSSIRHIPVKDRTPAICKLATSPSKYPSCAANIKFVPEKLITPAMVNNLLRAESGASIRLLPKSLITREVLMKVFKYEPNMLTEAELKKCEAWDAEDKAKQAETRKAKKDAKASAKKIKKPVKKIVLTKGIPKCAGRMRW